MGWTRPKAAGLVALAAALSAALTACGAGPYDADDRAEIDRLARDFVDTAANLDDGACDYLTDDGRERFLAEQERPAVPGFLGGGDACADFFRVVTEQFGSDGVAQHRQILASDLTVTVDVGEEDADGAVEVFVDAVSSVLPEDLDSGYLTFVRDGDTWRIDNARAAERADGPATTG